MFAGSGRGGGVFVFVFAGKQASKQVRDGGETKLEDRKERVWVRGCCWLREILFSRGG